MNKWRKWSAHSEPSCWQILTSLLVVGQKPVFWISDIYKWQVTNSANVGVILGWLKPRTLLNLQHSEECDQQYYHWANNTKQIECTTSGIKSFTCTHYSENVNQFSTTLVRRYLRTNLTLWKHSTLWRRSQRRGLHCHNYNGQWGPGAIDMMIRWRRRTNWTKDWVHGKCEEVRNQTSIKQAT